jgi:hypothetical protein
VAATGKSAFGVTHFSAVSVGFDLARTDLTPDAVGTGAPFSVGTVATFAVNQNSLALGRSGTAFKNVVVSTQSVNAGGVAASDVTTVNLLVSGVDQNASVWATPWSQWSSDAYNYCNWNAYAPSDSSVAIALSNLSNTDATIATVNWQIVVLNP